MVKAGKTVILNLVLVLLCTKLNMLNYIVVKAGEASGSRCITWLGRFINCRHPVNSLLN